MKKSSIKIVALISAVFVASSFLAGCKKADDKQPGTATNTPAAAESVLPVKTPLTLKYWVANTSSGAVNNYNEIGMYKEFEKKTGVHIEFIHPAVGQEKEQFNIMVASQDFPDILESVNTYYTGGTAKAFADGLIVDQKPLMDKNAPNLTKLYKTYPELNMEIETEEGYYFDVPWIKGSNAIRTQNGMIMRKDLLDDLQLKVPTTIQEFETALRAFKEKKGIKVPFQATTADLQRASILGAFGMYDGAYVDNGKVKYSYYTPGFKEYLTTMNRWFKDGLIDPEFPALNAKIADARIINGETGAYLASAGSGFSKYLDPGKEKNPKYDLVGVQYFNPKFGLVDPLCGHNAGSVSITKSNKNKEITMAWLDYAFTKEGNLAANFGIEGVSYKMENGYPKYTELITNNPEKLAMGVVGRKYARSFGSGPMVQDARYGDQFWNLPQQKEALAAWAKCVDETTKAANKKYGTLTPEESQLTASKRNEINTYVSEMFLKFVMGAEPLAKFDDFQAQLKKLGVEDLLKADQTAYDRFMKKFPDAAKAKTVQISDFFTK